MDMAIFQSWTIGLFFFRYCPRETIDSEDLMATWEQGLFLKTRWNGTQIFQVWKMIAVFFFAL